MSTAEAIGDKVRFMVAEETHGWGDQRNAVERLSRASKVPFWTLENLRTGRTKTVEGSVIRKVKAAYIAFLERKVASLQREIENEKAVNDDADLDLLETEVADLLRKVQARRKAIQTEGA
jgi:hypothetical protein